jgi:dsDNA-specific endonuclease/ATPase MutS2
MMAVFKIGDKVETIDDTIMGKVVQLDREEITIESDEGFLLTYRPNELLLVQRSSEIRVTNQEVSMVKAEKELPKRKQSPVPRPKERNAPKMEVDLHINQLVASTKGLSNHEMLNLQLETAKRQLQFAMEKRIQKVVFIHGVGEGVLKEELNYLFGRYDNVTHYDADYQQYGLGATEVYIYQKP